MMTIKAIRTLTVFVLSLALLSGAAFASDKGEFSRYAQKVSSRMDSDWSSLVSRTVPEAGACTADRSSARGRSSLNASSRLANSLSRTSWRGVSASGYMRSGESQFLQITTRDRSSPTRGTSWLEHPAQATLGGNRRLPFNAVNKYINMTGRVGRGSQRRHPAFGTRISTTSRRRGTSSSTLGATRIRRRR